jgi:hypothetical protein
VSAIAMPRILEILFIAYSFVLDVMGYLVSGPALSAIFRLISPLSQALNEKAPLTRRLERRLCLSWNNRSHHCESTVASVIAKAMPDIGRRNTSRYI